MTTLTHCHMCGDAHADWTDGDPLECQRCGFRVPAAHAWQRCPIPDRPATATEPVYVQETMNSLEGWKHAERK